MNNMQALVDKLSHEPTEKLQAIYNHASREHHNGIDTEEHSAIMAAIALIMGIEGTEITGDVGTYEFKRRKAKS